MNRIVAIVAIFMGLGGAKRCGKVLKSSYGGASHIGREVFLWGGVDPSRHHVVPALFFIFIIFLTAIWQPHGQLSAILRGTASPTRC